MRDLQLKNIEEPQNLIISHPSNCENQLTPHIETEYDVIQLDIIRRDNEMKNNTDEEFHGLLHINKNEKKSSYSKDLNTGKQFAELSETISSRLSIQMDENNKKAVEVAKTQGMEACIQHMFTEKDTGRKMSYGEMRMLYG